eukprot:5715035-Amphidinium_carterae.1
MNSSEGPIHAQSPNLNLHTSTIDGSATNNLAILAANRAPTARTGCPSAWDCDAEGHQRPSNVDFKEVAGKDIDEVADENIKEVEGTEGAQSRASRAHVLFQLARAHSPPDGASASVISSVVIGDTSARTLQFERLPLPLPPGCFGAPLDRPKHFAH